MRRVVMVGLAMLVLGCGSGSGEQSQPAETPTSPAAPEPEPEPPGPAPTVRVHGDVRADGVTPRIESRGEEAAEVGALGLQRQDGDEWVNVPATLELRDSCEADPAPCFTLARGAVLLPPAWTGKVGPTSGQCACEDCDEAPAGTYRFVVRGCGDTEPAFGVPFSRE